MGERTTGGVYVLGAVLEAQPENKCKAITALAISAIPGRERFVWIPGIIIRREFRMGAFRF